MPKSSKAPIVKTQVLTRHLEGASNTLIAEELEISRPTVQRILAESEIDTIVKQGRSRAISLIPRSLDVLDYRLERNDGTVAIQLLKGTNVLMNQALTVSQTNIHAQNYFEMKRARDAEQPAIEVKADEGKTE